MEIVPYAESIWIAFDFLDSGSRESLMALARSWRGDFSFEPVTSTHAVLALYAGARA